MRLNNTAEKIDYNNKKMEIVNNIAKKISGIKNLKIDEIKGDKIEIKYNFKLDNEMDEGDAEFFIDDLGGCNIECDDPDALVELKNILIKNKIEVSSINL